MSRWWLVVVVIAGTGSIASADQGDEAKARAHARQGTAYFDRGDFARALVEYEAAWKLAELPGLKFNMGLAHQGAGRPEKALELFEAYLEIDPRGVAAKEARARIAELTPIVEAIRAKAKAKRDEELRIEAERLRREQEKRERQRLAAEAQLAAEARAKAAAVERRQASARRKRIAGYATVALGSLSLGAAGYFGVVARGHANALSDKRSGAWSDALLDREDKGRLAGRLMIAFAGAGAVAVAAGVGLVVWGRSPIAVTPAAGNESVGASLTGRF